MSSSWTPNIRTVSRFFQDSWRNIAISLIDQDGPILNECNRLITTVEVPSSVALPEPWLAALHLNCVELILTDNELPQPGMKIADLKALPNWQATAVDNETGHAIAILRAGGETYHLYDGHSMTTLTLPRIEHPQGKSSYSIDEIRQMFVTRKLSVLEGYLPD